MSKTLLRQIQDVATESSNGADLPKLLRLCLMLASRLRNTTLKEWVEGELYGYGDREPPPYRVFSVQPRLLIEDRGARAELLVTRDVVADVLGEEAIETVFKVRLRKGVAELAALVDSGRPIGITWDQGGTIAVAARMTEWTPVMTSSTVSRECVLGLLDVVRTRVLTFALDLEAEDPTLGEDAAPPTGRAASKVEQIVNQTFNFHGNYANVNAPMSLVANSEQRLRTALTDEGLTAQEVEQVTALAVQEKTPEGVLAKMKRLGGTLAQKAAEAGVVEAIKQAFSQLG